MSQAENNQWVSMFQADQKVVPRSVWGRFAKLRWLVVWASQLLYYGLPWLQLNGRQALLFDLDARRFYLGPVVFYPQDLIYLTGLLIISALSLFLFTAVAGRVWCGYACPQTVYTEIFLWFERLTEGDRSARLRRSAGRWSVDRLFRSAAKHGIWIVFSLWTGFTFVGYFTPIRELGASTLAWSVGHWDLFWVGFYSFATFFNAGFMREQVCKYMCPYARFQSAMFDADTLLVTYDEQRGEPRGSRSRKAQPAGLGACVDCTLCVQVCPTGIDIRQGLQYECIGCAACVDVCDTVMDKMSYPRGLIRYSTQNAVLKGWGLDEVFKRMFRPRVLIYTAVVWVLIGLMALALSQRADLRVDVIRDRTVNHRFVQDGWLENVYQLNLMNATEFELQIDVSLANGSSDVILAVDDTTAFQLEAAESRWVVVRVQADPEALRPGSNPVVFRVSSTRVLNNQSEGHATQQVNEPAVFLAPY
jgi:cytochrome c oxidase accessory protein FixG